jgi:GGDEF domain-containing protein
MLKEASRKRFSKKYAIGKLHLSIRNNTAGVLMNVRGRRYILSSGEREPMQQPSNQSEVSRLLRQIEQEYQAAHTVLDAYTVTAQHAFITARLEHMSQIHDHLQQIVGDEAIRLIAECLEALPDEKEPEKGLK